MKALLATAMLAAGAPTFLGYFGTSERVPPAPNPVHEAEAPQPAQRYLVSNAVLGKACHMRRGAVDGATSRLIPEPACDAVWPGLSHVVALAETGRGTMAMKDAQGRPVLSLAAGDGVAFEAIEPRSALVTVSATN